MNYLFFGSLFRALPVVMLLLLPSLGSDAEAAQAEPPDVGNLIRAGRRTLEKFRNTPASWLVRCRYSNGFVMVVKVVRDNERRTWTFAQVVNGRSEIVSRVTDIGGIWYVADRGRSVKYRPYEAELRVFGGYLLLSLAELRYASDETQFASGKFEGRRGNVVSYRLPLPVENRRMVERSVARFEELTAQDPEILKKPEVAETYNLLREQLKSGTPLSVDETTGIVVRYKLRDLLVSIESFEWNKVPEASFVPPRNVTWDDQTQVLSEAELSDCVMVGHDPFAEADQKTRLSMVTSFT